MKFNFNFLNPLQFNFLFSILPPSCSRLFSRNRREESFVSSKTMKITNNKKKTVLVGLAPKSIQYTKAFNKKSEDERGKEGGDLEKCGAK